MIEIDSVTIRFGGVTALDNVSIALDQTGVTGVIGPNGSGKSTLINVVTGFYRPTTGRVTLDGEVISHGRPEEIRGLGIARTFQNMRLVAEMTVLENTMAGMYLQHTGERSLMRAGLADLFGFRSAVRRARVAEKLALAALDTVGLTASASSLVGQLEYAAQKRVELARTIALKPRLLILDEPTAGMSEHEATEIVQKLVTLAHDGADPMAVLMVEHRLELVLAVSNRVVVMNGGCIIADGPPAHVGSNPEVRRIYVGGE